MNIVTIDLETFWSQTHTLSKMSALEYAMHPDTELISCSWKLNAGTTTCVFGEDTIREHLSRLPWSSSLLIAHNMSAFDALILSWRLGIKPKMWGCTLAMARPLHAKTTGLSLAKLVKHYGIGVKNDAVLHNTRGKRLADFTPDELRAMAIYNADDVDQCYALFHKLKPHYTAKELWHIDAKIRALVEPGFEIDTGLLETALSVERSNKLRDIYTLDRLLKGIGEEGDSDEIIAAQVAARMEGFDIEGDVREHLASTPKFKALLEKLGVEVPMKPSPTDPTKFIPALSKTDEAFTKLQEHPDPIVACAARVRLSVKSTITETRMQAFVDAAKHTSGRWPVTTHYCGADTTGRASGWHYNPLNLPRIGKKPKTSDALRKSLRAPKDHKVVVADESGIEMRFNHFLWKVPYSTELWTNKVDADLYRAYWSRKVGVPEDEVTKEQRQASKIENLGLGFGMGPEKYHKTARLAGLDIDLQEATSSVSAWRQLHTPIVDGWRTCHRALDLILAGVESPIDPWGIFVTCAEGIRLPSGRVIRYPGLRREIGETGKTEWFYGEGRHKARIYAGKIDENIVQAGSRDIVYDVAFNVFKETGFRPALEVYDELVYVVPQSVAEDLLAVLHKHMRAPTPWFPALVKFSEGDIADSYGEAK